MVQGGTIRLFDEFGNDLNIDLSAMQLLTIIRILGLEQNPNNINDISCFGDKGLLNINIHVLDKNPQLFGQYKYPIDLGK